MVRWSPGAELLPDDASSLLFIPQLEPEVQRVNWPQPRKYLQALQPSLDVRDLTQEPRSKSLSPQQSESTKEVSQVS